MKKILNLILCFTLVCSLIPMGTIQVMADEEFISVKTNLLTDLSGYNVHAGMSENLLIKKVFAGAGDEFALGYTAFYSPYYTESSAAHLTAIDMEKFKEGSYPWKTPWADGQIQNTLIYNGVEYDMVVRSGKDGGSAIDLTGWSKAEVSITENYYDKVSVLANGYDDADADKEFKAVLTYADGTTELVSAGKIYKAFYLNPSNVPSEADERGFYVESVYMEGGAMNETSIGTAVETPWRSYIYDYNFEVDESKKLKNITFLSGNLVYDESEGIRKYQNGDTRIPVMNVFAVTALKNKSAYKEMLKDKISEISTTYDGVNINENADFRNAIKAVLDEASSNNIDMSDVCKPQVELAGISGIYEINQPLSLGISSQSDAFGRTVTLDIKWYKSDTITDDKSQWIELSSETSYVLEESDIGKYIYATVTPKCDAVTDIEAISTVGDTKTAPVFFKIVAPEIKDNDVYFGVKRQIESTYPNEAISVNYEYIDLNGDVEEGTVYTFKKAPKIDGEYTTILQTGTANSYTVKNEDLNSFIKCEVKVKNIADKGGEAQGIETSNVYYVQDSSAPYGMKLEGTYAIGNDALVLCDNELPADTVDVSEFVWYMTDDIKKSFPQEWTTIVDSTNKQYHRISDDTKFYAVIITPKHQPDVGDAVVGTSITKYFYKPSAPVALDITLKSNNTDAKKTKVGDIITATYKYVDPNNDSESGSEVFWEKSLDGVTGWTEFKRETNTTDKAEYTYTLADSEINHFIRFCVSPKSEGLAENEVVTGYSEMFKAPFEPTASLVSISGTPSVGSSLSASYKFNDENGNADIDSKVIWYDITGGSKTKLAEGMYYTLKSTDAGKVIMFELTPKTDVEPKGTRVYPSNSVTVTGGYSGGSSSAGGSFSGSGGSGVSNNYKGTVSATPVKPLEYIVENKVVFSDIEGHWAEKSILFAQENGIINGYNGEFRPNDYITRAEACAIIRRLIKSPYTGNSAGFSDVGSDKWYYNDINSLFKVNVISGDGDKFYPDNLITRQEAAKMFYEGMVSIARLNGVEKLKDVSALKDYDDVSNWAREAVKIVYGLGIVTGDENKKFNPTANLTRAEASAMIERWFSF